MGDLAVRKNGRSKRTAVFRCGHVDLRAPIKRPDEVPTKNFQRVPPLRNKKKPCTDAGPSPRILAAYYF
jgi:hypothetical protein